MSNNQFFYCYSSLMQHFLHKECGYKYVTKAIHPKTKGEYWLYERSPQLTESIDFYYLLLHKQV